MAIQNINKFICFVCHLTPHVEMISIYEHTHARTMHTCKRLRSSSPIYGHGSPFHRKEKWRKTLPFVQCEWQMRNKTRRNRLRRETMTNDWCIFFPCIPTHTLSRTFFLDLSLIFSTHHLLLVRYVVFFPCLAFSIWNFGFFVCFCAMVSGINGNQIWWIYGQERAWIKHLKVEAEDGRVAWAAKSISFSEKQVQIDLSIFWPEPREETSPLSSNERDTEMAGQMPEDRFTEPIVLWFIIIAIEHNSFELIQLESITRKWEVSRYQFDSIRFDWIV